MMYYQIFGDKNKPMLFLLHGENYVYSFKKQVSLSEEYCLIIPHLPGYGNNFMREFSVETALSQITELVEFFGRKVTLVGYSLGAQLCLPLICKYGHLFNGVIFISPWLIKSTHGIVKSINQVDSNQKLMKNKILNQIDGNINSLDKKEKLKHLEFREKININTLVASVDNGIKLEDFPEFDGINVPMLSVCGAKEDSEIRKSAIALSVRNKNCDYIIIDGASENIPTKNSSVINKEIYKFCKNNLKENEYEPLT